MSAQHAPTTASDVTVIGAGLLGVAATWRLSQRGYNEKYAHMTRDSRRLWGKLEQDSGRALITPTPCIDFGPRARVAELHTILQNVGIPSQLLARAKLLPE